MIILTNGFILFLCIFVYRKRIPMMAQTTPTKKPAMTCAKLCCRRIIRLVPRMPAKMNVNESHHTGLKPKNSAKTNKAPATPPMAAVWVEIFHHTLIMAQVIWMNRAAVTMVIIKWGMCRSSIR